jgi:hypothetical protein
MPFLLVPPLDPCAGRLALDFHVRNKYICPNYKADPLGRNSILPGDNNKSFL